MEDVINVPQTQDLISQRSPCILSNCSGHRGEALSWCNHFILSPINVLIMGQLFAKRGEIFFKKRLHTHIMSPKYIRYVG